MNKPTVFCRYCYFRFETKLKKEQINLNNMLVKVSHEPCVECGAAGYVEVRAKEREAS